MNDFMLVQVDKTQRSMVYLQLSNQTPLTHWIMDGHLPFAVDRSLDGLEHSLGRFRFASMA